jgi:hypothetical protein
MKLQEYALIENNQIIYIEFFKRPELVPSDADWRMVGEVTPEFDPTTHHLGERTLQLLPDGTVAYVWSIIEIPVSPPIVPSEIQNWQARTILERAGLFDAVDEAIKSSGNREMLHAWEYAPNIMRRSIFVTSMASILGLDDASLDYLFIEGSKIR